MKTITIPHSVFKNASLMNRDEWLKFLREHGIEPEKVLRVEGDREKTVYEVEE